MASTYSTNLAIELIGTGDQAGTWGVTTNSNLGTLIEQAISGYVTQAVATGTDTTITIPNGATGVARNMYIELTGTGGTNTNLIVPANKKLYFIFNNSTGAVTVKVSGQTGVSVPQGKKVVLTSNGTDIVNGLNYIADFGSNSATITQLTATSATITNLTLTSLVISNLSIASANITTLTSASATITNLINTSASITTLTNNPTFSAGTANGVLYLNGSKVATSGSALTFDGTTVLTTPRINVTNTGTGATFSSSGGSGLKVYGASGTNQWDIYLNGANVRFSDNTGGGAVKIDTNAIIDGNVGIGTSSPAAKLHVVGDSLSNTFKLIANTTVSGSDATIFRPADNTMAFSTNGAERARIDSSGNLGIGTSSPTAGFRLDVVGGDFRVSDAASDDGVEIGWSAGASYGFIQSYDRNASAFRNLVLNNAATLDTSGNLGLGITPTATAGVTEFAVGSASTNPRISGIRDGSNAFLVYADSGGTDIYERRNLYLRFGTNNTERARITAGGAFLVGTTTASDRVFYAKGGTSNAVFATFENTVSSGPVGVQVQYSAAAPNNTGNAFLSCLDNATDRAVIRSNGGLANYQSNNVDLSDARTKNTITPAASMWDKIGALEIVTYKYNDQTHDDVNVGVIAQQVESVEPVWVDADGFGQTPEGEEPLKTVYTKDITFAAIKALQEAMARIEKLEAEVAALKGA